MIKSHMEGIVNRLLIDIRDFMTRFGKRPSAMSITREECDAFLYTYPYQEDTGHLRMELVGVELILR